MHGKDDGFIITAFLTKRIKQIGGIWGRVQISQMGEG
jgi:hypothetical protein